MDKDIKVKIVEVLTALGATLTGISLVLAEIAGLLA